MRRPNLPISSIAPSVVALGAMFIAASSSAQDIRRTAGDWDVVCSGGVCSAAQTLASPKQPGISYTTELALVSAAKRPALKLSFPLGIYLPRGVGIMVGSEKRDVPVTVCLPAGCHALVMLDDKLTAAMLSEKSYTVRFYTTEAAPGEVSFSLKGFAQAQEAVRAGK